MLRLKRQRRRSGKCHPENIRGSDFHLEPPTQPAPTRADQNPGPKSVFALPQAQFKKKSPQEISRAELIFVIVRTMLRLSANRRGR
jgi:hypothetical protein